MTEDNFKGTDCSVGDWPLIAAIPLPIPKSVALYSFGSTEQNKGQSSKKLPFNSTQLYSNSTQHAINVSSENEDENDN